MSENTVRLAVLIDADNASVNAIGDILAEVSESPGKARLMLRRACLEAPRKGPMRRASAPPRADEQSSGKNSNMPNKNVAPQASRRSANVGVRADRLAAGVLRS